VLSFPRFRLTAFVAAALLLVPVAATAHPGQDKEQAAQNPALLAAVVALGGGAEHFSGAAFRRALRHRRATKSRPCVPLSERPWSTASTTSSRTSSSTGSAR
jgi:hypothetical protein